MLSVTTRGEGPKAALLLHGFLGSGKNLASLARRLAELEPSYRFVLPDLTGHGVSPPLPPGADLQTLARDVLEVARTLPAPVTCIGHSLGGRVALVLRDLAPEHIGAVALLDIGPGPVPKSATDLEYVLDALLAAPRSTPSREPLRRFFIERGLSPALADWLLMNLVNDGAELVWRIDREALATFNARSRGADLWPELERAKTPTFCIRGGRSRFVGEAEASRLRQSGATVESLAQAGHFLHVDAQAELVDALRSTLLH